MVLSGTLNYLTAADQLYISQSTLSKHILEMEKELDVQLFKRSTRKVELTECGMRLVPYAQRAVELQDAYLREVEAYKEWQKNQLTIGCIGHCDAVDLGSMNLDFQVNHPDINISLSSSDRFEEYITMVKNGTCDFAFVREENISPEDGLNRILLSEDPLYAFLPKSHPLAESKVISLNQLDHDAFLLGSEVGLSYKLAMAACQEAGIHPNVIYRGDRPQALNYLARGFGIALMFGNLFGHSTLEENIVRIPFEPRIYANINLVYNENNLTNAGHVFLDFVKEYQFKNASEENRD